MTRFIVLVAVMAVSSSSWGEEKVRIDPSKVPVLKGPPVKKAPLPLKTLPAKKPPQPPIALTKAERQALQLAALKGRTAKPPRDQYALTASALVHGHTKMELDNVHLSPDGVQFGNPVSPNATVFGYVSMTIRSVKSNEIYLVDCSITTTATSIKVHAYTSSAPIDTADSVSPVQDGHVLVVYEVGPAGSALPNNVGWVSLSLPDGTWFHSCEVTEIEI